MANLEVKIKKIILYISENLILISMIESHNNKIVLGFKKLTLFQAHYKKNWLNSNRAAEKSGGR
jgi:hypothetical protein